MRGFHGLGFVVLLLSGLACSPAAEVPAATAAAAASTAPGLRAYLNPATGTFEEPPPEVAARWAAEAAGQAAKSRGLNPREFAGPSPAGGVGVALDERFESALAATVRPEGGLAIVCGAAAARGGR